MSVIIIVTGVKAGLDHWWNPHPNSLHSTFKYYESSPAGIPLAQKQLDIFMLCYKRIFHLHQQGLISSWWQAIKNNDINLYCFGGLEDTSDQQIEWRYPPGGNWLLLTGNI